MKNWSIFCFLGLALCLAPAKSSGQNRVNYSELKAFFIQYEQAFKELSAPGPELLAQRETRFKRLFFNEEVPVFPYLDEQVDFLIPLADFLSGIRGFHELYALDNIEFTNFSIKREARNGVVAVKVSQILQYSIKDPFRFPNLETLLEKNSELLVTLVKTHAGFKITRMEEALFPLAGGMGSSRILPNSLSISTFLNNFSLIDDAYRSVQGMGPGYGFDLQMYYPIWGFGNTLFGLSPGLSYSWLSAGVFTEGFNRSFAGYTDKDGENYTLNLEGRHLEHLVDIGYLGIPLDLSVLWKRNRVNIMAGAGVRYMIPQNASFEINELDITYSGTYNRHGHSFTLYDIPRYGFGDFTNPAAVRGTFNPKLNDVVLANAYFAAGYDISPTLSISAGLSYHQSVNNLTTSRESIDLVIPAGQGNPTVLVPNLLAWGEKNVMGGLQVALRMTYNLKRPNIPYLRDVTLAQSRQVRVRPQPIPKTESPLDIYYVNTYFGTQLNKNMDFGQFAESTLAVIERESLLKGRTAYAYSAFGDSLFAIQNLSDLENFSNLIYRDRGSSYHVFEDFAHFTDSILSPRREVSFANRQVRFHFILASPFSHQDALQFADRFAQEHLGDHYKNTQFYLYMPILQFHRNRAVDGITERDRALREVIDAIENGPSSPYTFDYIYKRIAID